MVNREQKEHRKEGLIVKHREVDVSRIMTTVKIIQVTWTVGDYS